VDEQPIYGIGQGIGETHRIVEQRGYRHPVHLITEKNASQLLEDENQAEGEQHLIQVVTFVQPADESCLQYYPNGEGDDQAERYREPQTAGNLGEPVSEICADHVKATMGEIDDTHDSEDKRQPTRQ